MPRMLGTAWSYTNPQSPQMLPEAVKSWFLTDLQKRGKAEFCF